MLKMPSKKIYCVFWFNVDDENYTEIVECYSNLRVAEDVAIRYNESHGGQLTYFVEEVDFIKK